jgi:sugar phosphate permease
MSTESNSTPAAARKPFDAAQVAQLRCQKNASGMCRIYHIKMPVEHPPRFRWAVLLAGSVAQASFSAFALGLPALAPALRSEFGLTLGEVGLMLAVTSLGVLAGLLPSGLATDVLGERVVVVVGLLGAAVALLGVSVVDDYGAFLALLIAAGAFGTSVNAATGRAVMTWFQPQERGLALGIRQTAIPIAGVAAAVLLPPLAAAEGVSSAFVALSAFCLVGAGLGAAILRDPPGGRPRATGQAMGSMLRHRPLWRLSIASVLVCVAQISVIGFVVLFLHDERGLSAGEAALVLAASQLLGAGMRIGLGVWSDRLGSRIVPFRRVAVVLAALLGGAAVLLDAPLPILVPALVVATGVSMGWNSLSFAAAAEIGGATRSGAAIGLQQTTLAAASAVVPVLFAFTVVATSWQTAFLLVAFFPLAGWWTLRSLEARPASLSG